MQPTLIILGGLPGSGKTTLARALAQELGAVHLRIDTIEHALAPRLPAGTGIDDLGYRVAFEVARDNLRLGRTVVGDSVNPIEVSREGWHQVARSLPVPRIEVEVFCSDLAEHEARVRDRVADIDGHVLPTWCEVVEREWEPWTPDVRIDTAGRTVEACVSELLGRLRR